MGIEYHGWVALATSQPDWCDDDFEAAFERVASLLAPMAPEDGHWASLTEPPLFPRMVYLNGVGADSIDPARQVIRGIAALFDRAYGDLAVFDAGDRAAPWDHARVVRYAIRNGGLSPMKA